MFKEYTAEIISEAKAARAQIKKVDGIVVSKVPNHKRGDYLLNYANLIMNRQIDIFDDSIFLLENKRYQAACIISRGMIETHAFGRFLNERIEKTLVNQSGKESVEKCLEILLKFMNSSRFKKNEQEKIKKGVFKMEDYSFTAEAKHRFENFLSVSQHVADALKELYIDEKEQTAHSESAFELLYDALSEHVHPSQTSIFQYYTPEIHHVKTSFGLVHAFDSAEQNCARALHFIVDANNIKIVSEALSDEINKRWVE